MKKAHLLLKTELSLADTENYKATPSSKFVGTRNPRHMRVLLAFCVLHELTREEVDKKSGASNGPDLIRQLKRLGLKIRSRRVRKIDRDGRPVTIGIYSLVLDSRRDLCDWINGPDGVALSTSEAVFMRKILAREPLPTRAW